MGQSVGDLPHRTPLLLFCYRTLAHQDTEHESAVSFTCVFACVCARVCVCVCAFAFASKKKNAARCKQMRNTYQCSRSCAVLTPRSIITHGCGCQSVHQHCSRILACKKINAYTEMHASLQAIFIANHPDTMRARYLEHRNHWAEDGLALGGRSNLAPQPRQMAGCPTYFQGLWFVR